VRRRHRRLPNGKIDKLSKGKPSVEPMGIAVAADGAAWFTDSPARAVSRIAADGTVTSFALTDNPIARLNRLALAPDGAVWFADSTALSVTRLRDGVITEFRLPRSDARPFSVAVDAEGNVWYTDLHGWPASSPPRARGP
jgi:virginiamycin B lyase